MFKLNKDRVIHRKLLDAAIDEWLSTASSEQALEALQQADRPP